MSKWYVVQRGSWRSVPIYGPYETQEEGRTCLRAIQAMHSEHVWYLYDQDSLLTGPVSRLRLNESDEVVDLPTPT